MKRTERIKRTKRMEKILMNAVRRNRLLLKYIEKPSKKICLEAIKQDPDALKYVWKQNEEMCLEAVRRNGTSLKHVINQTEQICLEAVKKDSWAFDYVEDKTRQICLEVIKGIPKLYFYKVEEKYRTPELCLEAVKRDGMLLCYVENQTEEICLAALKSNAESQTEIKIPLKNVEYGIHQFNNDRNCRTIYYAKVDGEYLFSIGCQINITKEKFIDRIYNDCRIKGKGLIHFPHRRKYLEFLESLN